MNERGQTENLETHGIVALVCDADDRFLLLEDSRELMRGSWAPPHGRCESSDVDEAAGVIREVKEETNLDVEPVRILLTQPADTKVRTVSFWLVNSHSDEVIIDSSETSKHGWFSVAEALELKLYPGTRLFFDKVVRGEIDLNTPG
jgi:ADP-ribose pyrophosphatase YjhB (NUDIX family)